MAVPRNRMSHSRKNMRRSHHALKRVSLTSCSQCNEPVRPHRVCGKCGTYRGRTFVEKSDES